MPTGKGTASGVPATASPSTDPVSAAAEGEGAKGRLGGAASSPLWGWLAPGKGGRLSAVLRTWSTGPHPGEGGISLLLGWRRRGEEDPGKVRKCTQSSARGARMAFLDFFLLWTPSVGPHCRQSSWTWSSSSGRGYRVQWPGISGVRKKTVGRSIGGEGASPCPTNLLYWACCPIHLRLSFHYKVSLPVVEHLCPTKHHKEFALEKNERTCRHIGGGKECTKEHDKT